MCVCIAAQKEIECFPNALPYLFLVVAILYGNTYEELVKNDEGPKVSSQALPHASTFLLAGVFTAVPQRAV